MNERTGTLRWIASIMGRGWTPYGLGMLLVGTQSAIQALVAGELYRAAISVGEGTPYPTALLRLSLAIVILLLFAYVGVLGQRMQNRRVAAADRSLRSLVVQRFVRMTVWQQTLEDRGFWYNLVARDLNTAGQAYRTLLPMMLNMACAVLIGMIVTAVYSWKLMLFVVFAGLLIFASANVVRSSMRAARTAEQSALRASTGLVHQVMRDLLTVRFYGMEDHFETKLAERRGAYQEAGHKALRLQVWSQSFWNFGFAFAYVGSLAYALLLVERGELNLSNAMFIWPMSNQVSYAIQKIGSLWMDWQAPATAMALVRDKVDAPLEVLGETTETDIVAAPSVTFEDVSFAYPTAEEAEERRWALRHFTLHVPAGQKLAILGISGSGKSTLFKLLLGFYEPTEGRILLDGVPVSSMSLAERRRHIAYLPQAPRLYEGTLGENLRLVSPRASEAAIEAALQRAGLTEFAGDSGKILDHAVGYSGNELSGGERQRAGIARALLRDAKLYLMDEMTSALDSKHDLQVTESLMALEDTTVLWITHRVEHVGLADRVVTLDRGEVVGDDQLRARA